MLTGMFSCDLAHIANTIHISVFFFLMIRRPPRSTLDRSSAASDVYKRQRLCIARALAVEPEIILMDEPASALDPISTAKIEELIHDLKQRYTIVIVTHNMQQAARVSDMTAFFYLGELVEFDRTTKILSLIHI